MVLNTTVVQARIFEQQARRLRAMRDDMLRELLAVRRFYAMLERDIAQARAIRQQVRAQIGRAL